MGKTSAAVKNKYASKTYDQVRLLVKKGEKSTLQAHASKRDKSLNAFINRAIKETIERDNATGVPMEPAPEDTEDLKSNENT